MKKLISLIIISISATLIYADVKFEIYYTDQPGTGFHLYPEAKKSFEEAAALMGSWLDHDAVVNIEACSEDRGPNGVLAHTPNDYTSKIFIPGIYYHNAARKILFNQENNNNSKYDLTIVINNFHFNKFGYGDEIMPEEIDFKSTVMHEITHALGFVSSMKEQMLNKNGPKDNEELRKGLNNLYLYYQNPDENNEYKQVMEQLIEKGLSMDEFVSNYDLIMNGGEQFTFFDTLLYDTQGNRLIDIDTFQFKRPDLFELDDCNPDKNILIYFKHNGRSVRTRMNGVDASHFRAGGPAHLMRVSEPVGPGPRKWSNIERSIMESLGYKLKKTKKTKWIWKEIDDEDKAGMSEEL